MKCASIVRSASLGALRLSVLGLLLGSLLPPQSPLERLTARLADQVTAEARFTASSGVRWIKPVQNRTVERKLGTSSSVQRALLIEAPEVWTVRALSHLASGQIDEALQLLGAAVEAYPRSSALRSDLAATFLERARRRNSPRDLVHALEHAEAGHAWDPDHQGILYNHALAAEKLHLEHVARQGWQRVLEAEAHSAWGERARESLDGLVAIRAAERWRALQRRFETAPAPAAGGLADELAAVLPQAAADYLLADLLGEWGEAHLAGEAARAQGALHKAAALAAALDPVTGDPMATEAMTAIDAARAQTPVLHRLAEGHAAFAKGRRAHRQLAFTAAESDYRRAARLLAAGASPQAHLAAFYEGVALDWAGRHDETRRRFEELAAIAHSHRYGILEGYCRWMLGLLDTRAGRFGEATAHYRVALERFSATRQEENVAITEFLLAEIELRVGNYVSGWRRLGRALAGRGRIDTERWIESFVRQAAQAAGREGLQMAALVFLNEAVAAAAAQGNPAVLVEARCTRATALLAAGRSGEAKDDLDWALADLERVADPRVRERLGGQLASARAELFAAAGSAAAVGELDSAIDYYGRQVNDLLLAELFGTRGRLQAAHGDLAAAEADLVSAVRLYERQRQDIEQEPWRISFFDGSRQLFDTLLEVRRRTGSSPAELLATADLVRARGLAPPTAGAPQQELPLYRLGPDTALLYYAMTSDRLLTWTADATGVDLVERLVDSGELTARVNRGLAGLRGDPEAALAAAAELYDELLRPVVAHLRGYPRLKVVPDGVLHRVPFAALYDRESGRFFAEDHALVSAPGGGFALGAGRCSHSAVPATATVLAIGDPAFDSRLFPHLPRLPGAAAEASTVAATWPGGRVLAGAAATPERFLASASEADVVHVAAHAVAHPELPFLSYLLLADEPSIPGSGTLFAHRLTDHAWPSTRLVVLSACSSAGTAHSPGEGMLGLAWSFLSAGVPAVVASLWSVDDADTERFFYRFHQHLRAGRLPDAALRLAQIESLAASESAPKGLAAWAPFVLYGGGTGSREETKCPSP